MPRCVMTQPTWLETLSDDDAAQQPPSLTFRPLPLASGGQLAVERHKHIVAAFDDEPDKPLHVAKESTIALQDAVKRDSDGICDARRLRDVIDSEFDRAGRPYILAGFIGEGGMGIVHLARQRTTGREVAIKAIRPELVGSAMHSAFRAECEVTAGLEHPNIPPVYDAGDDFMVMKRLRGLSFESMLHGSSTDAITFAVEVILKVCDALAFAHSQGVVHRDIKGDNVLVGTYGQVWLMDWGLAASLQPGPDGHWHAPRLRDRRQLCAGTPMCLPPEVACGDLDTMSFASDLFMVGALLYRALGGIYPFESPSTRRSVELSARCECKPLMALCPNVPFRLSQTAQRAMAWDPRDRGTVGAFADDLRTWLHTSGAAEQAEAQLERARRELRDGDSSAKAADAYAHYCNAIGACERALGLCPEQRAAHELVKRAREGFIRAALSGGDLNLARLVSTGFNPGLSGR